MTLRFTSAAGTALAVIGYAIKLTRQASRVERVVTPTCDDVRAVVAWIGEAKAEEAARTAGVSEGQMARANLCSR